MERDGERERERKLARDSQTERRESNQNIEWQCRGTVGFGFGSRNVCELTL